MKNIQYHYLLGKRKLKSQRQTTTHLLEYLKSEEVKGPHLTPKGREILSFHEIVLTGE